MDERAGHRRQVVQLLQEMEEKIRYRRRAGGAWCLVPGRIGREAAVVGATARGRRRRQWICCNINTRPDQLAWTVGPAQLDAGTQRSLGGLSTPCPERRDLQDIPKRRGRLSTGAGVPAAVGNRRGG